MIAFVIGAEEEVGDGGFTVLHSLRFRLYIVGSAEFQEFGQGNPDLIDHGPIELGILPFHNELDVFVILPAEISDQPWEFLRHRFDRHHTNFHHDVL